MRILYVNSGASWFHGAIDTYIYGTLQKMDCEVRQFDLRSHIEYFKTAMQSIKEDQGIDYDGPALGYYASSPLLCEVNEFQPQLVLVFHGAFLSARLVEAIKRMGCKTALWVADDPYEIDNALIYAGVYDYIFTVDAATAPIYKRFGSNNVFHLPLAAYPPLHHRKVVSSKYRSDVCFIGSAFYNRLELFDEIADYLSTLNLKIIGQWWEKLRSFSKLKPFIIEKLVGPAEAACYYNGAKINLNLHRASDTEAYFEGNKFKIKAVSPNNRTFEIAGCGAFQLADNQRQDLGKYFRIGEEIEIFEDANDLVEKIEHYLNDSKKRERMSQNAQKRSYEEHTFRNRLEFLLDTIGTEARRKTSFSIKEIPNLSKDKSIDYYQRANPVILEAVPSNVKRVLDVGCGAGFLGEKLKERGVEEVFGIEISTEVAKQAEQRLDKVVTGDVERIELPFTDEYFDCIIYGDVLEHFRDPWRILNDHRRLLKDGGLVVSSLPNVAYFPVVKSLLTGRWHYEEAGVLDNTHLRFFTLSEILKMFQEADYEMVSIDGCTYEQVDENEIRRFIELLKPLDLLPQDFQFQSICAQYLLIARKKQTVDGRERNSQ